MDKQLLIKSIKIFGICIEQTSLRFYPCSEQIGSRATNLQVVEQHLFLAGGGCGEGGV